MKKIIFFALTLLLTGKAIAQAEPVNYTAAIAKFKQFYNRIAFTACLAPK
jgi:hypothetical protein